MNVELSLQEAPLRDLRYFVEWRPALWTPPVRWLIENPQRFRGKRVLDLGCRYGRMSCFFGLLGADVVGVDLEHVSLDRARQEAKHWHLADHVAFASYDGDPKHIPGGHFDFIFSKSVLVVVPALADFLQGLKGKLATGGEILVAENMAGGNVLAYLRKHVLHRRWVTKDKFHGVDDEFVRTFQRTFPMTEQKKYYGLVTALRGRL